MTEYRIPTEPDGPVWDKDGSKWERKDNSWMTAPLSPRKRWSKLIADYGPLRDYPPEPAHGTRWVAKNGGVLQWRRNERGAALHGPKCGDDCAASDGWERAYRLFGPLTPYVEPEPEPVPETDPWEDVKPGRLYWVTGHSKFWTGKVRGLGMKYGEHECMQGDGWLLMRSDRGDRLQSVVELTAIPTHLLDALIETAVDYDDPEDGTSVSREALHNLTDWLADHPQNEEMK